MLLKRVAVTGASGHIGFAVCQALIRSGFEVNALYHSEAGRINLLQLDPALRLSRIDVLEPKTLMEPFSGADIVIHLAGRITISRHDADLVYATNVSGTRNVARACQLSGVKKLIHFSSIHSYQYALALPEVNESTPKVGEGAFVYDYSKMRGEQEVRQMQNAMDVCILAPTSVIGPFDFRPSLMGAFFLNLSQNTIPALVQGGFDFVDVRDVAKAAVHACNAHLKHTEFILSGHWVSIPQLAAWFAEISGVHPPKIVLSPMIARIGLPFVQAMAWMKKSPPLYTRQSIDTLLKCRPNISSRLAQLELGFRPRPIEDTLRDIAGWLKQNTEDARRI